MSATSTPTGRYPTRTRRVGVVIAAAVIGLISLGWLGWVIWDQSTPEVRSTLRTWHVVDDHTAIATIGVRLRTADVQATCLLRAFADDHSTVGETNVSVPTGRETRTVEGTVRTERRATSIELVGCTAEGQRGAR